jgi:outer membrane protein assembly factor BamA
MMAKSELKCLCKAVISLAFIVSITAGQCAARNSVATPASPAPKAASEPSTPDALVQQPTPSFPAEAESPREPDLNGPGSAPSQAQKPSFMTDRIMERDRKFPMRDYRTGIELVKHINGIFGGLEQGSGLGFGLELTTANSIPGMEFRGTILTSSKLYRRFEGEVYIPKIGDEKTHATFWYGYLRRTKDNFFGIGPCMTYSGGTNFDVKQRSVNGGLFRDFTESFQAGIYFSYINSNAYGGRDVNSPPIDAVFSGNPTVVPITLWAPGLHSGSNIISYGLYGEYDRRNYSDGLTKGFYFYGRFGSADALDRGIFSDYGWLDGQLDARAYIPLFSNKTSLALRGATELKKPKGGSQIPFYEMSYLGGSSHVRGFNTYRFRGNNFAVVSVELRQTVFSFAKAHRGVDLIGFGDGGQVWGDNRSATDRTILANDLFASRNWKAGIGGGVQYRHTKSLVVRIDAAHSQDGTRAYFSVSRGF